MNITRCYCCRDCDEHWMELYLRRAGRHPAEMLEPAGGCFPPTWWGGMNISVVRSKISPLHHLSVIVRAESSLSADSAPLSPPTESLRLYNVCGFHTHTHKLARPPETETCILFPTHRSPNSVTVLTNWGENMLIAIWILFKKLQPIKKDLQGLAQEKGKNKEPNAKWYRLTVVHHFGRLLCIHTRAVVKDYFSNRVLCRLFWQLIE